MWKWSNFGQTPPKCEISHFFFFEWELPQCFKSTKNYDLLLSFSTIETISLTQTLRVQWNQYWFKCPSKKAIWRLLSRITVHHRCSTVNQHMENVFADTFWKLPLPDGLENSLWLCVPISLQSTYCVFWQMRTPWCEIRNQNRT